MGYSAAGSGGAVGAEEGEHRGHTSVDGRVVGVQTELAEDGIDMLLDGRVRDVEGLGDCLIGSALRHLAQDLGLPFR